MGRDPAQQTAPDLFSTDKVRDISPLPTKPGAGVPRQILKDTPRPQNSASRDD